MAGHLFQVLSKQLAGRHGCDLEGDEGRTRFPATTPLGSAPSAFELAGVRRDTGRHQTEGGDIDSITKRTPYGSGARRSAHALPSIKTQSLSHPTCPSDPRPRPCPRPCAGLRTCPIPAPNRVPAVLSTHTSIATPSLSFYKWFWSRTIVLLSPRPTPFSPSLARSWLTMSVNAGGVSSGFTPDPAFEEKWHPRVNKMSVSGNNSMSRTENCTMNVTIGNGVL
ncbi:hypothetical protein BDK51DRAFT_50859 [Blyttiomyces helicus]|uniref:Uncharacterized protein n=1 Tax=Blyttiomyces helicus TaxID=388810 RepID=A0A4P9WJ20_9FUNG|nr:hypothetical protein BDK51DRAFT_50859 [Blyttiomyces helicus]|eukprot:RKO90586.1 hypothetical protein BDK51DRAFT_50859 [Blyttiomyces helicus]